MSAQPPAPDQRHVHVQPVPLSSDLGIATFQADDQTLHYVALILAHPGGECVHLFDPRRIGRRSCKAAPGAAISRDREGSLEEGSMKSGIELIAAERARQVAEEGYDTHHDRHHYYWELSTAAAVYVWAAQMAGERPDLYGESGPRIPSSDSWPVWPFHPDYWKPTGDPVRALTKAGALIAAEIDRLVLEADIAQAIDPRAHERPADRRPRSAPQPQRRPALGREHLMSTRTYTFEDQLHRALAMARERQQDTPTREGALVVTKLEEAILWNDQARIQAGLGPLGLDYLP